MTEWLDVSKELSRARQPRTTALTANMVLLKSNGQAHTYLTARGELASKIHTMNDRRCTIQIAPSLDKLRLLFDGGDWVWGRASPPRSANLAYRICVGVITQWPGEYRRPTACRVWDLQAQELVLSLPDKWATSWGSGNIVPSRGGGSDFPEYIGNVRLSIVERYILKQIISGARTNVEHIGDKIMLERQAINTLVLRINRALRGPVFKGAGVSVSSNALTMSADDKRLLQAAIVAGESA